MAKKIKVKLGDIFSIPLDGGKVGLGQVAGTYKGGELFIVVFEGCWDSDDVPPVGEVVNLPIVLASLSLDALLWHGHWQILGNYVANFELIRYPVFKIDTLLSAEIEDVEGQKIRKATKKEIQLLPYRTTVAPIRIEKAFKAINGLEEWQESYNELKYESLIDISQLQ